MEMDVKAGGGQVMTVGEMLRAFLTKLEWFSSLFPRIPVPIQQKLEKKLNERFPPVAAPVRQPKPVLQPQPAKEARHIPDEEVSFGEAERFSRLRRADGVGSTAAALPGRGAERDRKKSPDRDHRRGHSSEVVRSRGYSREKRGYSRERSPARYRDRSRERSPVRYRGSPVRKERSPRYREKEYRHRSRDHKDSSGHRHRTPDDFADELRREKERQRREKDRDKERGKDRDRAR
ncbi:hypothetical protein C0J52_08973 [Blattella germanica]|nr:hypothetical protein C0J52_08973 [Blattella germanica]